MKLLEHEAKSILSESNIPIPSGTVITDVTVPIDVPVVLKSQVLSGRRNKYGGVQIVHDKHLVHSAAASVLKTNIEGFTAESVLAEELLDITREFYLCLLLNHESACVELLALKDGGVDVESHDKKEFFREEVLPTTIPVLSQKLAEYFELETHEFTLEELLQNLYSCIISNDVTLLEINPLALTASEKLVAADCKMILDDAAAFRHPGWNFYNTKHTHNFVTLNQQGSVATIANGAGLAMATVDAVEDAGLSAANFLDIGGGATKETVLASFQKIMEYPQVNAILINIFAGITRCDEVARAIIAASNEITNLPQLFIRLDGTNVTEAKALLEDQNIPLYTTLPHALEALQSEVSS